MTLVAAIPQEEVDKQIAINLAAGGDQSCAVVVTHKLVRHQNIQTVVTKY